MRANITYTAPAEVKCGRTTRQGLTYTSVTTLKIGLNQKRYLRERQIFWADRHYWAPEVYANFAYNGAFYMFASFKSADRCRGTMVLKADKPDGKFTVHSEGTITPPDWESLDGTLYISKKR